MFLFVEQVGLVEQEDDRHSIGFRRCEEAIDEGGVGFRVSHRDDQYGLVDVGGNDVALLTKIGGTPYDIVTALLDIGDEGGALSIGQDGNPVAYGHGIGTPDVGQSEPAFYLRFDGLPIVGEDGVPAARIFDD